MQPLAALYPDADPLLGSNGFILLCHELRTPLTVLRGMLSLEARRLRGQPCSAEQERDLRSNYLLASQVERLARVVEELLDHARPLPTTLPVTDLDGLLLRAKGQYGWDRLRFARNSLVRPGLLSAPRLVHADDDQVLDAVGHLLHNARTYAPRQSWVRLCLRETPSTYVIEVSDTGRSLSADQAAHIWEPFYQAPFIIPSTGGLRGLGLGLTIVRRVARMHGGRAGHRRARGGQGNTFYLELPKDA